MILSALSSKTTFVDTTGHPPSLQLPAFMFYYVCKNCMLSKYLTHVSNVKISMVISIFRKSCEKQDTHMYIVMHSYTLNFIFNILVHKQ